MMADEDALTASFIDVETLPGFRPIPRSEWDEWVQRMPVERQVKSVRHISEQPMGSCVGHSCGNIVEAGCYTMAGDLFFRKLSFISMYKRIGRSPNSGAYVGDSADEIFERGILPADGERDIDGSPYLHTHQVQGGFYDDLPSGWEQTAKAWRASLYRATTDEAVFRVLMDCRLGLHIARSRHALRLGGYTGRSWWYENSWGDDWGDFGKSIGYDSRVYGENVYMPVARDELGILIAERASQEQPANVTADDLGS